LGERRVVPVAPVAPVGSLVVLAVVVLAVVVGAVVGGAVLAGARVVTVAAGLEVVGATVPLEPVAVPERGGRCPLSLSTAMNRARNTTSTAAARAVGPGRNLTSLEQLDRTERGKA
jgi:hypothetical protein